MPKKELKDLMDEAVKELCSVVPTPKSRAREILLGFYRLGQQDADIVVGNNNVIIR